MTVELQCYVCGAEESCINGLCADCTMKEFWNPGTAFAATFGSLPAPEPRAADTIIEEINSLIVTSSGLPAYLLSAKDEDDETPDNG